MEENVVFKTATVGGFEKRAVLDYIYKMNEQMETEREGFQQKIKELEQSLADVETNSLSSDSDMEVLQQNITTLNTQLANEKNAHSQTRSKIEELQKEMLTYQKLVEQKEIEKQNFIEENKAIIDQTQSIAEKQAELDKASYQLGRVMLDARTDADNIVEKAEKEAKEMLEAAQKEIDELKQKAEQERADLLSETKKQADSQIEHANTTSQNTISEADRIAKSTINCATSRAEEIVLITQTVAEDSTLKLRDLRRETLAIRQAIQEAFLALQEKSDFLDLAIETAQTEIADEQLALASKDLLELPELDLEKAKMNPYEEPKKSETVPVEPKQTQTIEIIDEPVVTNETVVIEEVSTEEEELVETSSEIKTDEPVDIEDALAATLKEAPAIDVSVGEVGMESALLESTELETDITEKIVEEISTTVAEPEPVDTTDASSVFPPGLDDPNAEDSDDSFGGGFY